MHHGRYQNPGGPTVMPQRAKCRRSLGVVFTGTPGVLSILPKKHTLGGASHRPSHTEKVPPLSDLVDSLRVLSVAQEVTVLKLTLVQQQDPERAKQSVQDQEEDVAATWCHV